jgi:hypothetical protein
MRCEVAAHGDEYKRRQQADRTPSASSSSLFFPAPIQECVLIHRFLVRAASFGPRFFG